MDTYIDTWYPQYFFDRNDNYKVILYYDELPLIQLMLRDGGSFTDKYNYPELPSEDVKALLLQLEHNRKDQPSTVSWGDAANKAMGLAREQLSLEPLYMLSTICIVRYIDCILKDLILEMDDLVVMKNKYEGEVWDEGSAAAAAFQRLKQLFEMIPGDSPRETCQEFTNLLEDNAITWTILGEDPTDLKAAELLATWNKQRVEMCDALVFLWNHPFATDIRGDEEN